MSMTRVFFLKLQCLSFGVSHFMTWSFLFKTTMHFLWCEIFIINVYYWSFLFNPKSWRTFCKLVKLLHNFVQFKFCPLWNFSMGSPLDFMKESKLVSELGMRNGISFGVRHSWLMSMIGFSFWNCNAFSLVWAIHDKCLWLGVFSSKLQCISFGVRHSW